MSKSYYEVSNEVLSKKLMNLCYGNIVDFFRDSDEFVLAITLAYFSLAEELIVDCNHSDNNINTRFKRNVSDQILNSFLTGDINIRDKEENGNSVEWFLTALRNGIMHNGFDVDYENRVVNVKNDGALNKLDCSISFDWFENFILYDLLSQKTLDDYKYTFVFNPFVKRADKMRTPDDIKDFIQNDLFAYDIKISFDENNQDKLKITRNEFIGFCKEKEYWFWQFMNFRDELKPSQSEQFNKYEELVTNELISEKDKLSDNEYKELYYDKLFNYWFTEQFRNRFPNYSVSISNFDRKSPKLNMVIADLNEDWLEKHLFSTKRKQDEIFDEDPILQRMDVSMGISKIVNYDKVDYLMSLQSLLGMYYMHKDAVKDDYGLSKFMKKVLNTKKFLNHSKIEEEYKKSIYDGMLKDGINHSYDNQITNDIIFSMYSSDEDVFIRCRELCDGLEDYEISNEKKKEIMNILKSEFPDFYNEVTLMYEEEDAPSDQVLSVYNENDLYRLNNAKWMIQDQIDEMIIGLLYTLGINSFVVNKETKFDNLSEKDYEFMNSLNIIGYSKDSYTKCSEYRNNRNNCNTRIKAIEKTMEGLKRAIAASSDQRFISEKNEKLDELKNGRDNIFKELVNCNNYLDNRNNQVFGGVNMSSLSNIECMTTIRNCFAHSGRIFIEGRKPGGDIKLMLTDYDENGNLSGVVKTDLSSLINFFNNPVLKCAVVTQNDNSNISEKSK